MRPFRKPKAQNQNLTFPNIAGESNQASRKIDAHSQPTHPLETTDTAPVEKLTDPLQPGPVDEREDKNDPKDISDPVKKKITRPKKWHPPFDSRPQTCRLVRVKRFSELSGYSGKAVYRKIEDGVWLEGREYWRAPDRSILMDLDGFERWGGRK
jgi:hypothetical protein